MRHQRANTSKARTSSTSRSGMPAGHSTRQPVKRAVTPAALRRVCVPHAAVHVLLVSTPAQLTRRQVAHPQLGDRHGGQLACSGARAGSGGQGAAQAASGGSAAAVRAEAAERSAPPSTHATTRSSIWAGSQPLCRGMPWQSCCCSAKRGAAQHERDFTQTLSPCKRVPNLQTPTRAGRARAAGSAAGGGLHGLPTNKAIAHCEQDAAIGRKEAPACAGA